MATPHVLDSVDHYYTRNVETAEVGDHICMYTYDNDDIFSQNPNIGDTLEDECDDTDTDECDNKYEASYFDSSLQSWPPDNLHGSQVSNAASSQSQPFDIPSSQSRTSDLQSAQSQSSFAPSSLDKDSETIEDNIDDGTIGENRLVDCV